MISSAFIKKLCFAALFLSLFSACRFWQQNEAPASNQNTFQAGELKSEIPFSIKEPENFQAELVIKTGETERKTFVARNGANRFYTFNYGQNNATSLLQSDKHYLILPDKKQFAENSSEIAVQMSDWDEFLTVEFLNSTTEAEFEKLETLENITKYRVLFDGKQISEALIYFDEAQKIPVKQEFYSVSGEQKDLIYTFEIRDLKMPADAGFFVIPPDFKKVSIEELRKEINKND